MCTIYKAALCDLMLKLNTNQQPQQRQKLLTDFALKYFLTPEHLNEFNRHGNQYGYLQVKYPYRLNINRFQLNQKHTEWANIAFVNSLMQSFQTMEKGFHLAEETLTFPHKNLEVLLDSYFMYSVKPLSATTYKNYQISLKHYQALIKCGKNSLKWCNYLLKNNFSSEIVFANFMHRLNQGFHWKNQKLWKRFIAYLKKKTLKSAFDIYCLYTRLFISDKEAVEEFRAELEHAKFFNAPVTKYWIETIEYELDFGGLKSAYAILERALKSVVGKPYKLVRQDREKFLKKLENFRIQMEDVENQQQQYLPVTNGVPARPAGVAPPPAAVAMRTTKPTVYFQNPQPQKLSFHENLVLYFLKTAKASILKKLYFTSKHFYNLTKIPVCYKLEILPKVKPLFSWESLFIENYTSINNFYIYHTFNFIYNTNRKALSTFIPKIYKCDVFFLLIANQDITRQEFEFLLSDKIQSIQLENTKTFENGQHRFLLTPIIEKYPKLKTFTSFTAEVLEFASVKDQFLLSRSLANLLNFQFECIDIKYQTLTLDELRHFIGSPNLQHISIARCKIFVNGNALDTTQIWHFIDTNLPQGHDVHIFVK